MNLFVGRLVEVSDQGSVRKGKVEVGRARTRVWLDALPDAAVGDSVLVSAGVAIARVNEDLPEEGTGSTGEGKGEADVPGRSR